MISYIGSEYEEVTLNDGDVLFKADQKCDSCFIVRNGHIACFSMSSDKRVIPMFSIKDNGLIAEDCVLSEKPRYEYNAVALTRTVLVKIPRKDVMTYLNEAGDWMKNILFDLSDKVKNTTDVVVEHKIVDERLNGDYLLSDEEQKVLIKAIS